MTSGGIWGTAQACSGHPELWPQTNPTHNDGGQRVVSTGNEREACTDSKRRRYYLMRPLPCLAPIKYIVNSLFYWI